MKCLQCERQGHYRAGTAYSQPLCDECQMENELQETKAIQTWLEENDFNITLVTGLGNWSATHKDKNIMVVGGPDGKWNLIKGYSTTYSRGLESLKKNLEA